MADTQFISIASQRLNVQGVQDITVTEVVTSAGVSARAIRFYGPPVDGDETQTKPMVLEVYAYSDEAESLKIQAPGFEF